MLIYWTDQYQSHSWKSWRNKTAGFLSSDNNDHSGFYHKKNWRTENTKLELHGQDPRFTKYNINSLGFLEGVSHKNEDEAIHS